jgi:hypothetical protein
MWPENRTIIITISGHKLSRVFISKKRVFLYAMYLATIFRRRHGHDPNT